MVFIMVVIAAIFFLVADQLMGLGIGYLLGIGG
jgi:preprotein translocase subunit SecE